MSSMGQPPILKSVFILGGGGIALEEVQYADQKVGFELRGGGGIALKEDQYADPWIDFVPVSLNAMNAAMMMSYSECQFTPFREYPGCTYHAGPDIKCTNHNMGRSTIGSIRGSITVVRMDSHPLWL